MSKIRLDIISDKRWEEINNRIDELSSIYDVWDHGSKEEEAELFKFYQANYHTIATDLNYLTDEIRSLQHEVHRLNAELYHANEDLWIYKNRANEYYTDLSKNNLERG